MTKLGVAPQPVRAEQYVQVSDEALRSTWVYGHRRESDRELTGWIIIDEADDPATATFDYYSVSDLEARRYSWTSRASGHHEC